MMFDVPSPLYAAAKLEARQQGLAMRDVVLALLAEWIRTGPRWRRFLARTATQSSSRRRALRKSRKPVRLPR